jgi:hypothetical protein
MDKSVYGGLQEFLNDYFSSIGAKKEMCSALAEIILTL